MSKRMVGRPPPTRPVHPDGRGVDRGPWRHRWASVSDGTLGSLSGLNRRLNDLPEGRVDMRGPADRLDRAHAHGHRDSERMD